MLRKSVVLGCSIVLCCGLAAFFSSNRDDGRVVLAGDVGGSDTLGWKTSGLAWPGEGSEGKAVLKALIVAKKAREQSLAETVKPIVLPQPQAFSREAGEGGYVARMSGSDLGRVRVEAAVDYDRDMRTATQAEEMRARLNKLEEHVGPALRSALGKVRAVLMDGSVASLEKARNMLASAVQAAAHRQEDARGRQQKLNEPDDWTRGCEPHCGEEHNVFSGIDTTKYPYDERHGGHHWHPYTAPAPSGIDETYTSSEHVNEEAGEGSYHWTNAAAKPEKNVWDHIGDALYPGPWNGHAWRHDDRQGYYVNVFDDNQGQIKELFVPASEDATAPSGDGNGTESGGARAKQGQQRLATTYSPALNLAAYQAVHGPFALPTAIQYRPRDDHDATSQQADAVSHIGANSDDNSGRDISFTSVGDDIDIREREAHHTGAPAHVTAARSAGQEGTAKQQDEEAAKEEAAFVKQHLAKELASVGKGGSSLAYNVRKAAADDVLKPEQAEAAGSKEYLEMKDGKTQTEGLSRASALSRLASLHDARDQGHVSQWGKAQSRQLARRAKTQALADVDADVDAFLAQQLRSRQLGLPPEPILVQPLPSSMQGAGLSMARDVPATEPVKGRTMSLAETTKRN